MKAILSRVGFNELLDCVRRKHMTHYHRLALLELPFERPVHLLNFESK